MWCLLLILILFIIILNYKEGFNIIKNRGNIDGYSRGSEECVASDGQGIDNDLVKDISNITGMM